MSGTKEENGIPFRFERFDRLRFAGREYVYLRDTDTGHVLRNVHGDLEETFTRSEMAARVMGRDFRHDRRFFAEGNINARAAAGVSSLAQIPVDELPKVIFKHEFCTRFLKMEAQGNASRSDESMDGEKDEAGQIVEAGVIASIAVELAVSAAQGAKLAGQRITTFKPPCAKTLRRWLAAFESGGFQAYALRQRDRLKGNRTTRLEPEAYALLEKYAKAYMSEKKPTIVTLCNDLEIELGKINVERKAEGLPAIATPSQRSLRLRIAALSAFDVHASRNGLDAAKRYFNLVKGAPEATRPGERVEIDEWTINLQKILIKVGLWAKLSIAERKAFTGRRLVCVAIDVATKCFLGLRMGPTATGDLARQTLRMVVGDKAAVADAAGARTPWDMRTTPDLIVSDGGPAFISDLYKAAVADIESERDVAKCKMPHLRGTIERSFQTCDINLLPRFTGRSFANIDEKGDYDSEARASLTEEDLAWSLVRWVTDVYHNAPHGGLCGESPRNAWLRLGGRYGIRPPSDRDKTRAALGVRLDRNLSMRGVRFLGNHYTCKAIADEIMARHLHEVAIRVDEEDLGCLSVEINGAWYVAECVGGGFDGVSATTWIAAMTDLRRRFTAENEITRPIVLEAIAAINARAADAERTVGIVSLAPSAERIEKAERELVAGFFLSDEEPAGNAENFGSGETDDPFDTVISSGATAPSTTGVDQPTDDEPQFSSEDD